MALILEFSFIYWSPSLSFEQPIIIILEVSSLDWMNEALLIFFSIASKF
jgi:hypothetical protein